MVGPGQVFRPGGWSAGDAARNVLLALPAVAVRTHPHVFAWWEHHPHAAALGAVVGFVLAVVVLLVVGALLV